MKILSALWALVRAWEADGKPELALPTQRFEEWSRIVGGIVLAAAFGDPLEKPEIASGADVERRDMAQLVKALAPSDDGAEPPVTRIVLRFEGERSLVRRQAVRTLQR